MNARNKIRRFGIVLSVILFVIGTINLYKNKISFALFFYLADLVTIILVIINPVLLNPIYKFLLFISHIIGWINTRILLCAIYYLVFSPIGLVLRIFRKDPLDRKFDRGKSSYWVLRDEKFDPVSYERQW